jgi:integrase
MVSFSDTYVKNKKSTKSRHEEYEGGGFGLRISPNGLKTWIYRYKIGGVTSKLTLGHYPNLSLADARQRFNELRGLRMDGTDPKYVIEQEEQQKNNTVAQLSWAWFTGYAEKSRKQPEHLKRQVDVDIIPLLGRMTLDKIQTRDIARALDKIVKRAPVHANRVLSTIKQIFTYGTSRGDLEHNPARDIRSRDIGGQEKARERVLTMAEIKKLWLFLDNGKHEISLQIKNAIKIVLLTGVRSAELRLAQWAEFSFDDSLWTIPAEHSKAGMISKIHLSSQVKELLLELKDASHSDFVLSNVAGNAPLSVNAIPRAINRAQERIGIAQWRAHDLRRTFATQLGESLRVDAVVIEKCLGHKLPKIMATYNKNEMLHERKEALNRWAQHIENLVTEENVIPFEQAI